MKYIKRPLTVDAWDAEDILSTYHRAGITELPTAIQIGFEEGLLDFDTHFIRITNPSGFTVARGGDMLIFADRQWVALAEKDFQKAYDPMYEPKYAERVDTVKKVH